MRPFTLRAVGVTALAGAFVAALVCSPTASAEHAGVPSGRSPNGTVRLVSIDPVGNYNQLDVSPDGRFLVYAAFATRGAPVAALGKPAVFTLDLTSMKSRWLAVGVDYSASSIDGDFPRFTANGAGVVFVGPSDLIPDGIDTRYSQDLFVIDLATGVTGRLVNPETRLAGAGRIAYTRQDYPDLPNEPQVYVKDLDTGAVTLVSAAADGTPSNQGANVGVRTSMSKDQNVVVFNSSSTNLTPGGPRERRSQTYVKDLRSGLLQVVPADSKYRPVVTGYGSAISADGRRVTFMTYDSDRSAYTEVMSTVASGAQRVLRAGVHGYGLSPDWRSYAINGGYGRCEAVFAGRTLRSPAVHLTQNPRGPGCNSAPFTWTRDSRHVIYQGNWPGLSGNQESLREQWSLLLSPPIR